MNNTPSKEDWFDENFQPPKPWEDNTIPLDKFLSKNDDYVELSSDWDKQIATIVLPDQDSFQNEHNVIYEYLAPAGSEAVMMDDTASPSDEYFHLALHHLNKALHKPNLKRITAFYKYIKETTFLHSSQAMEKEVQNWEDDDIITITAIARWITLNSPDRNAVKFGLLILALFPFEDDNYIFYTFQKHEEFIPYCIERLLRQHMYRYITEEEMEIDTLILYSRSSGYGRYYILKNIINNNDNNEFDTLLEKLFLIGPPIRWANTDTALLFIQNINIEKYLNEDYLDPMAVQSILLIIKNLMIPNMETTLEFFEIPNSLTILEKLTNRIDDIELNITKICLLQRIMDYLETYQPSNTSETFKKKVITIHNGLTDAKIKHQDDWKALVREHLDTDGPDFPRMVNHLANELFMQKETGGNRKNALKFLRMGNNVMRDVALYSAENHEEFLEAIKAVYQCDPKPEDWNSAKKFITAQDRDFCAALIDIIEYIYNYPKCIDDIAGEMVILDALDCPHPKTRLKTLEELSDLRPFWTDKINDKLKQIAIHDPDKNIKKFTKNMINQKTGIFR